jgi:hypothetical protein
MRATASGKYIQTQSEGLLYRSAPTRDPKTGKPDLVYS